MLPVEEAQLKLKDVKQALAYEKAHRYVDVQGRKKPFSRYMSETLRELGGMTLEESEADLEKLIARFKNYPFMDVGNRMHTLELVEKFITRFNNVTQPKRKIASNTNSDHAPLHETEVQYVRGVGPKFSKILAEVGINTVEDLLYYFPRRYIDYNNRSKISQLTEGEDVTIIGTVTSVTAYNTKNRPLTIVSVTIADETGSMSANWFYGKASRPQMEAYKNRFAKGAEVMLSGRVKFDKFKKRMAIDRGHVEILSYADGENEPQSLHGGRIVPVYPLTQGLSLRILRRAINQALADFLPDIVDPLPADILKKERLRDLQWALQQIHFPESMENATMARERLVFDEFFYLQARLALLRQQYKQTVHGLSMAPKPGGLTERFVSLLPWTLTGAQQKVFDEIKTDLHTHEPMYRLLQGDVGSGKTVVAIMTLLVAIENGYQGALMVPTEILAEQHYRRCVEWLTPLGLKVGQLVGKLGAKQKREVKQDIYNGQIHLVVGTHALIQDDLEFNNLGVIVVDEQHRFGVKQRTLLKDKGNSPEMLTMTATPIPRTLAMTVHGDLDVSLLNELPPGRTPIKTLLLSQAQAKQAYQLARYEIGQGRQCYIVFPLVEESETLDIKSATAEAGRLQKEVFPDLKVGLLHGKMHPDEKEKAMNDFVQKKIDILVSTTVIEVGVDVPNATVMIIEHADRFGLAQLHQLRGRVGRGSHQSYCALVSGSRTQETMERLKFLVGSEDGFAIAEKDLEIRGPGEFLGTRQSGVASFLLADIVQDQHILERARKTAFEIVAQPEYLQEHPHLNNLIFQKTEDTFSVLGSG